MIAEICPVAPLVDLYRATSAQLDAQQDRDPDDVLARRLAVLKDAILGFPASSPAALRTQAQLMREHIADFEVRDDLKDMIRLGASCAERLAEAGRAASC